MTDKADTLRNALLMILAVLALGYALRVLQPVLVPVVLALFIALVVSPVERWVADRVPGPLRWLGLLAAMALIAATFALFVAALWVGGRRIGIALSGLPRRLDELTASADFGGWTLLGADIGQLANIIGDRGIAVASALLRDSINGVSTWVVYLTLCLFLVLLMLTEAPRWLDKLRAISDEEESARWHRAIRLIAFKLRVYLVTRAYLGLMTAVLYGIWLWICGVELVVVWVLLVFLFSFIPNLGSVLAGLLPLIYAFIVPGTLPLWAIALGILAIEQGMGNLVQPQVQAKQVSLSPVVVLLSVIFFGWLWGAAGALLSVPIMIVIVVAAANVEAAKPFALLLSNQTTIDGLDRVMEARATEAGL